MSGSGGGDGPSFSAPSQNDSCENIVINTNLASPQANVIANLTVGDRLDITAVTDQGPIQALDVNGQVAGNIISREQIRLLNCIRQGTVYVADVLEIDNGQCQVQIHSA
jgi:hypothetical protein